MFLQALSVRLPRLLQQTDDAYGIQMRQPGGLRAVPHAVRLRPEFIAADRIRDESGCVLRHERSFMRPLLPTDLIDEG